MGAVALVLCAACNDTTGPGGGVPASPDLGTMRVGDVRVLLHSQMPNGLSIPVNSGPASYVVMVANAAPGPRSTATMLLQTDRMSRTGGQATTPVSPSPFATALATKLAQLRGQAQFEQRLRSYERSRLQKAAPHGPWQLRKGILPSQNPLSLPAVGDTLTLNAPGNGSDLCVNPVVTKAVVKAVGSHSILVLDTRADSAFTTADYQGIDQEFEHFTYPVDSSYFGPSPNPDGSVHVVLFFTPSVNLLTPPGSSSFIGGFFFTGDLFPQTASNPAYACPASNQRDIVYLMVPDPTGRFNNVMTTDDVRQIIRGVIPHEIEHMINAGAHLANPSVPAFEVDWLDEGLAHIAEEAVGRAEHSLGDQQTLTINDVADPPQYNDFNAFFYPNLARFQTWLQHPDTSSAIDSAADENLSSSGACWALVRYVADAHTGGNLRAFTHALVVSNDTGVANLSATAHTAFGTLLADWVVTNTTDHAGIPGLSALYNYIGWNMRDVETAINQYSVYPLQPIALQSGHDSVVTVPPPGSASYFLLNAAAGNPAQTFRVLNANGTLVSFPGATIYVVRVQ